MSEQMSLFPNLEQDNPKRKVMTKQEAINHAIQLIKDNLLDLPDWSDDDWSEIKEIVEKLKEIKINE